MNPDLIVYHGYVISVGEYGHTYKAWESCVLRAEVEIWRNSGYVTSEAALLDARAVVNREREEHEENESKNPTDLRL